MASILSIAELGFLIGDPARANMLFALKGSGPVSSGDLARAAGVAPSTASGHLARLIDAGIVTVSLSGRNRYYRLASSSIGEVLDGLDALAGRLSPDGPPQLRDDQAALHARSCTDHLAGRLGVRIAEAILSHGMISPSRDGLTVSPAGEKAFNSLGIDIESLKSEPRIMIVLCHDWSEDRVHLGGALGGRLFRSFLARDWMRRERGAQIVNLTPKGRAGLRQVFGVDSR